jgi:formate--tetrahydrofolate ligase
VAELAEGGSADFRTLYPDEMGLMEKIETIATRIYRAGSVTADASVRAQLKAWEDAGYGICRSAWPRRNIPFRPTPTCAARQRAT